MPRTIRLLAPIVSEGRKLGAGVVVDATNDAASLLLEHDPPLAEATDATERHHAVKLLHSVTLVPEKESGKPKKKAEPATPAGDTKEKP